MENTFHTIWWVPETAAHSAVAGYLRAFERAERALDADLAKYLPLWRNAVPPEFENGLWDFSKFGRGDRFVYEPIPRSKYDEVLAQVKR